MQKRIFLVLILALLLINNALAVQVVEVGKNEQTQQSEQGWFDKYFGFFKEAWFWYILVGIAILLIILVLIFFIIRWLIKYIKRRNDIYYMIKAKRLELARIHRRYPSKHWWKVEKNTPVRLARKDENGKLYISNPIGFHRGDYVTHEGNQIIALNLLDKKVYWFFPTRDLLVIPNKEKVTITQRNEKGEIIQTKEIKLPTAKDIVQFNENEILIYAESVSAVGEFYIPVLKAGDGKIVDLSLPIYQSIKDVVLGEYLYSQSSDYVQLSRKAVDMNVSLRASTKLSDTNSSVEVPSANVQENP